VRAPAILPDVSGMTYMLNDTASFQGRPDLPLRVPLPRSLNAGFLLFNPANVDFDFLEWLGAKFFRRFNHGWLVEQTAWAALAGREKQPHFWSANDARNISGFTTLTPTQIGEHEVRLFGSRCLAPQDDLPSYAGDARILHFSGMSKHSWSAFQGLVDESLESDSRNAEEMHVLPDSMAGAFWRVAISLRLGTDLARDGINKFRKMRGSKSDPGS